MHCQTLLGRGMRLDAFGSASKGFGDAASSTSVCSDALEHAIDEPTSLSTSVGDIPQCSHSKLRTQDDARHLHA